MIEFQDGNRPFDIERAVLELHFCFLFQLLRALPGARRIFQTIFDFCGVVVHGSGSQTARG